MGDRGPAAKPRSQHQQDGTYRADRHGSGTLPVEIPGKPGDLTPVASAAWNTITKHLESAGLVSSIDGHAIRLLCESWELYLDACEKIAADGLIVQSVTKAGTNDVPNPAIRIRDAAWKQVYLMLRQFGMTPSARTGLNLTPAGGQDPFERLLQARENRKN